MWRRAQTAPEETGIEAVKVRGEWDKDRSGLVWGECSGEVAS